MEAIGQRLDRGGIAVEERPGDRALTHRERQAARSLRLQPAYNDVIARLHAAEEEVEAARYELEVVATNLVLGDATEADVGEVEAAITDAERLVRRWTAAARRLDDERGVIRDSAGNVLR